MTSIALGQTITSTFPLPRMRGKTPVEVDTTRYPDSEPMARSIVESNAATLLKPVLEHHQAQRGIPSFVGTDNFIYYVQGDNTKCVAPDLYVYVGLEPNAMPMQLEGHNNEQCWKTWLVGFPPMLSIEIKSLNDPRKDELESPDRYDVMGTYELIVFDPFIMRRREERKQFTVFRRNSAGKLLIVEDTDLDRVYSEVLDAFLLVDGVGENSCLRLATGPNGNNVVPFDGERADANAKRAEEEARRADANAKQAAEEARLRQDAVQRAAEEARLRQDAVQRAAEEARLRQDAVQRAEEALRRAAEMEEELARLRAATTQPPISAKSLRATATKRPTRAQKK